MSGRQIVVSDWKPLRKGSLRGFVTVSMPSGMTVHEVSIMQSNGRAWASPPSKPMIDRDGRVMLDDAGKRRYSPIIAFQSKEIRDRWSEAVIAALLAAHPEALANE
jgi:DNA-binding cell septation regulator SpoVG